MAQSINRLAWQIRKYQAREQDVRVMEISWGGCYRMARAIVLDRDRHFGNQDAGQIDAGGMDAFIDAGLIAVSLVLGCWMAFGG